MLEQERKFLLKGTEIIFNKYMKDYKILTIQQGYLILKGKKQLRVRVVYDTKKDKFKGFICYKFCHNSLVRDEYEYEIPLKHAKFLYNSCNLKLEKTRYSFYYKGDHIDIDSYKDGSNIVEIEYKTELKEIPEFCGREITGVKKYSNIEIARKNSKV